MRLATRIIAAALTASTLSGCVALELAHLVYITTNMNIGYTADADVKPQPGKYVYWETFHTEAAYGDPCYADSVIVDYSAKTDSGAPVALATFDPSSVYGQAVIFYKETCGLGDAAQSEDVVLVGSRRQIFGEPMKMKAREKMVVHDYFAKNGANRPDWMPQVLETIQTQAEAGDEDAKRFLAYVHIEDGEPVLAGMAVKGAEPGVEGPAQRSGR